jgi:hypothetical protein
MAKYRVSFDVELPTDNDDLARDWAAFVIGWCGHLKGDNPCIDIDLPVDRDRIGLYRPCVSRVE